MSILFIFDDMISIDKAVTKIAKLMSNKQPTETLYLFPLTSHYLLIQTLEEKLQAQLSLNIKLITSSKLIDAEVNKLQENILSWSSTIAAHQLFKKPIKEWFLMPDKAGSAWWLSLISEKNSVQSQLFFKIAQINAISQFLNENAVHEMVIVIADKAQQQGLKRAAKKHKLGVSFVKAKTNHLSLKQKVLKYADENGWSGALLSAFLQWYTWLWQSRLARKNLSPQSKRKGTVNPFLFITYFPNIDNEAAEKNIFANKYALPLEKNLKSRGVPITWLLMPVFYNGHNYHSAIELAKRFSENGEKLMVLQEFFTLKVFFKTIIWWLKQTIKSLFLLKLINKTKLTQAISDESALPIIRNIWHHSFTGTSGVRGIIFYLSFSEVFKSIPAIKDCLYFCEMQAWEKALLFAKKKIQPNLHTMAFQHTVVPKNFFHYFYHPNDILQKNVASDFPLPEKLIANGNATYHLLKSSGFPNLWQAEAIRQLYLKDTQKFVSSKNNRPVLFVAGSYDRNEMKSLLTLLYRVFPLADQFEIWLKASPINPLEPLFKELGIDIKKANYKICRDDVSSLLADATVAFVANTTVAIEAAALGIPVVIPLFADTMLMNPIIGTHAKYHSVSNCEEFEKIVNEKMFAQQGLREPQLFIDHYWNLDASLPLWNKILDASAIKR